MYRLQDTAKEVLDEMIEVGEEYLKEIDELIQVSKNPEKLVGKKFEQMGPMDFQFLHTIMGKEKFDDWFVDKEYAKVRELEAS